MGGWVQAIRESLGMTLEAFGARLGISRQTAHQLENSEVQDRISLRRLRAAAEALDCELVCYLRPKRSLEAMVQDQARNAAEEIVSRTGHSMALEVQGISSIQRERLIDDTANDLMRRGETRIWQWK